MNVEIGTEAAQFPGKEYINGIFVAVGGAEGGGRGRSNTSPPPLQHPFYWLNRGYFILKTK